MSHPELFLRVLGALVDEVVDFSADLSREDVQRNSIIKDSMRGISPSNPSAPAPETTVMPRIFGSMVEIIRLASTCNAQNSDCSSSSASLAVLSFSTMKLYVSWVDINLIMHENVINAIFGSLTSRQGGVAEAAADCVLEIVNKGMDELMKLQLLQQLNLFEVLSTMSSSSLVLEIKLGEIVNAVGVQLLALFDNQPSVAAGFLQQWLQLTVKVLCHNSIEVSSQVFPCLSRFTMSLGKQRGFGGGGTDPANDLKAFLPTYLSCLYRQMQYPAGHVFEQGGAGASQGGGITRTSSIPSQIPGLGEGEDDSDDEETYRNSLRKMYSKIVRWHPDTTLEFVGMALSRLPAPLSSAPFPPCEAALRLLFHFQEGLSSKGGKLIGGGG
ncbi:hypothetical protein TrRE_jg1000, partial [Triparma retinervis]